MNQFKGNESNILIVDDKHENLTLLRQILTDQGHLVRPSLSGKHALQTVNANMPDLILLDIMMPEMDGYELCQKLKADERTREIPVIFLSALGDVKDKVKAFSVGGVDYITKPFNAKEVLARVNTHLELKFSREELKKSYEIIKNHQEKLELELEQGRQTQLAILPKKLPQIPNTQITSKFVPNIQIGGDFYDVFDLEDGKFGIFIADVTGHGVSAALISAMISGIFRENRKGRYSPESVLRLISNILDDEMPEGKYVSMFYGIYDSLEQTLLFTNAGHPAGLVIRKESGTIFQLSGEGNVVGILPSNECMFGEEKFQFIPGDKLLLYTDAIIEVMNDDNSMLGIEGVSDFLAANSQLPIRELLDQLFEYCISFSSQGEYEDDCTMIGLEIS